MDEEEIIRRAVAGETDAFAILVRKYHRNLLRFIHRLVGDPALTEDLGQEVFLQVYRELPRFEPERGIPFAAWLYTIARNRAIDALRQRGRRPILLAEDTLDQLPARGRSPEEALLDREEVAALAATLAELPEPFRGTILMSLQGASLAEIAERCGIGTATVKSRLFRARERLQALLKNSFGGTAHEKRV